MSERKYLSCLIPTCPNINACEQAGRCLGEDKPKDEPPPVRIPPPTEDPFGRSLIVGDSYTDSSEVVRNPHTFQFDGSGFRPPLTDEERASAGLPPKEK